MELCEGFSVLGGGATPEQTLPTHLIRHQLPAFSAAGLKKSSVVTAEGMPIIARIEDDAPAARFANRFADEEGVLACALVGALR